MGGVTALEVRAQVIALDGVRQDHRRLTLVLHRRAIGRVHLAVVVPAAAQAPDIGVGQLLHQCLGARIAGEEIVADIAAVVGPVGLEVTVGSGVHQVDQRAVLVRVEQRVPAAAPDHLDDVPARTAEERLQFLDDLAVAAHRPVEPPSAPLMAIPPAVS